MLLFLPYQTRLVLAEDDSEHQCGLYLALSSTSTEEHTIWGIYAGKDYEPGQMIGVPELAVNTHNLRYNVMTNDLPTSVRRSLEYLEE